MTSDDERGRSVTVLLADDHFVVRQGLRAILEGAGMRVVAEVDGGKDAVQAYAAHRPDVCVVDVRMPGLDGVEAIARIVALDPGARVVALSSFEGDADIKRALAAGAATYVLKRALDAEFPELVRAVYRGERRLDRQVRRALSTVGPRSELTDREVEILSLIARGESNKSVAERLGISVNTVNNHVASILIRLDAADRTEAVTIALRRGIVRLD